MKKSNLLKRIILLLSSCENQEGIMLLLHNSRISSIRHIISESPIRLNIKYNR